ncbi:EamA family transporter [Novosphingobium sp. MMS21-SN21R]|uniref:EamA family transporter n=1 Tax=Novosphingobium sp. MMS21-SN21R TaxID=2969298 RepID=UPI002883AC11|nr:EamA family transporter [Novosphingobium sp. MMS21-SN21R]MDT0510188.1 EamA family transporter [Novosphingobium sp. MMS21-SN21R]
MDRILMAWIFGLLAALAFGGGDFLGGLSARRTTWGQVALMSQLSGLLPLTAMAFVQGGSVDQHAFGWSLGAGVGEAAGICLLYKALAEGQMAVVAPVTALLAIALPVLVTMATGPMPGLLALAGIAAAVPALILISREPSARELGPIVSKSLLGAVAAGFGVAMFMICLSQAASGGVMPALIARGTCAGTTAAVLAASGAFAGQGRLRGWTLVGTFMAGVWDATATICLLAAMRLGSLANAATLASLYPAVTIILAAIVLRERLSPSQHCGLAMAGLAVMAITQST